MDNKPTTLQYFKEVEWLKNDKYLRAASKNVHEFEDSHQRVRLCYSIPEYLGIELSFYIVDNKIVVIEEDVSTSKNAVLFFDNCKQLLNYMDHIEKLLLLAKLQKTKFKIQRDLASEKANFTIDNSYIKEKEGYKASIKAVIIDEKSNTKSENLSNSKYIEKQISQILHLCKIKFFGRFKLNKNINFTDYDLTSYQINKITELIYPSLNLTEAMEKALEYYRGCGFISMNSFLNCSKEQLRNNKAVENLFNSINGEFIENIKLIIDALENNELKNNQVLYRGGSGKSKNLNINEEISYDSFVSTSASKDVAESFGGLIYEVCLPKGSKCIPMDNTHNVKEHHLGNISEAEFLLPPSSFKIIDIKEGQYGRKIVELAPLSINLDIDSLLKKSFEYWKNDYIDHKSDSKFFDQIYDKKAVSDSNYISFLEKNPSEQKEFETVLNDLSGSKQMGMLIDQLSDSKFKTQYLYKSKIHGKSHNERVAFLAAAIAHYENLPEDYTKILLDACKYHDIGRENDDEDPVHGKQSSEILQKENIVEYKNQEDLEILKYIIANHNVKTFYALKNVKDYNINDVEKAETLLKCLKDADNLDRVRIYDLDPNYLRTASGKALVRTAYQLYPRYKALFKYERLIAASFPSESPHTKEMAVQVDKSKYAKLKLILSKALMAFKDKMEKPEVPKDLAANKTDIFEF